MLVFLILSQMSKCLQADRQMDSLEGDHENTNQDFFDSLAQK